MTLLTFFRHSASNHRNREALLRREATEPQLDVGGTYRKRRRGARRGKYQEYNGRSPHCLTQVGGQANRRVTENPALVLAS